MILDIAAGVLIAAAIGGVFWFGAGIVLGSDKFTPESAVVGWVIIAVSILCGAALVAWRLFR